MTLILLGLHYRDYERLPWVAGSGKSIQTPAEGPGGFIFCARVGDHPRPQYRWVPLSADGEGIESGEIAEDTLTCLGKAVCGPGAERVLPESTADLAYDAWEAARHHIHERWEENVDPASTQPAIPKPMRDAADLLNSHRPKDLEDERFYRLLDTIETPYDTRTQRMMRKAIDGHEQARDKVQAIIGLVEDLGLQPPPPVEQLPDIEEKDVSLVAWLALVPTDSYG